MDILSDNMTKYNNLLWENIQNEEYDNLIEEMEHSIIKLDDGTTIFNVYLIGQAIAHNILHDEYYDIKNDIPYTTENNILDYTLEYLQNIIIECVEEAKYKLNENNIQIK